MTRLIVSFNEKFYIMEAEKNINMAWVRYSRDYWPTDRLHETAEQQQWLPETQTAFRKNRCVKDYIFTVRTLMEK